MKGLMRHDLHTERGWKTHISFCSTSKVLKTYMSDYIQIVPCLIHSKFRYYQSAQEGIFAKQKTLDPAHWSFQAPTGRLS